MITIAKDILMVFTGVMEQIIRKSESASKSNGKDSSIEQVSCLVSRREKRWYTRVPLLNRGPLSFVVYDLVAIVF